MERFVKDEIARRFRTLKRFLTDSEITDSTFYRVVQDSPAIGADQYRRLEGALDLPRYVLDYIAEMNIPALEQAGLESDQLRAITELFAEQARLRIAEPPGEGNEGREIA